ncbi:MAG: hypothetical protein Q8P55_00900 [bacterium]|nr:hypothetical protein [bacterium]
MTSAKHICTGAVLQCMDFRLRRKLADALEKHFPQEDYDLISIAGGVQDLLREDWREFVFKQFDLSRKLHEPSLIVLVQHEDCGAYGGTAAFGDFERELKAHQDEIRRARVLLEARYPETRIEGYLFRLSGEMIPLHEGETLPSLTAEVLHEAQ